jgi:hypothetical protein
VPNEDGVMPRYREDHACAPRRGGHLLLGPFGVRNGKVTEFERPAAITFRQPMTLRLGAGTVDVTLRYALTPGPAAGVTRVTRVVTMTVRGG